MFIQATKDNKGGRNGCYCALVRTIIKDGKNRHEVLRTIGAHLQTSVEEELGTYASDTPILIWS